MSDQLTKKELNKFGETLFEKFQNETSGLKNELKSEVSSLIIDYSKTIQKSISDFNKTINIKIDEQQKVLDNHNERLNRHLKKLDKHDKILENHVVSLTNIERDVIKLKGNQPSKKRSVPKGWIIGLIIYGLIQMGIFGFNMYIIIKSTIGS